MEASLRLKNELNNFRRSRQYGTYARPFKNNIFLWNCQLYYKGYFIKFTINFPETYPMNPPTVRFVNHVFHPNIYNDRYICLDILENKWSPSITIRDILNGLTQLLDYPNTASPANTTAAEYYNEPNKKKYQQMFKSTMEKYHKYYTVFTD